MPFAELLELAKHYKGIPADAPKVVIIYEVLDHTASVKVVAWWGIDYMHLAKYDDRWLIVHVLWQTRAA
jgi:hypothetical protein